jgi:hypothetical protein
MKCTLLYSTRLYSTRHEKWNEVVGRFAKLSTPTEAMRQKAHGKGDGGLARQAAMARPPATWTDSGLNRPPSPFHCSIHKFV